VAWVGAAAPDPITVTVTIGDGPAAGLIAELLDGITIPVALGGPTADYVSAATIGAGPAIAITLGEPAAAFTAAATPDGIRIGLTAGQTDITGTSGGPNYIPAGPPETVSPRTDVEKQPLHVLAIGAANAGVPWRGAPNHRVGGGAILRASAPTIMLPGVQGHSFTLRLNAGSEARSDHEMDRSQAIIIEEMMTDLWWRRRDAITGAVEPIGRFNADKVDISATGPTLNMSVNWVDYRALLEDRMVLKYLDVPGQKSTWAAGTPVTQIMRFAIPTNTNIDVSAIEVGGINLGVTTQPYELPPGDTMAQMFDTLRAVSNTAWEWWIESPDLDYDAPKLQFAINGRGADKGIVLFDTDGIRGPIASWTMQAAKDDYANALFFSGEEGGEFYVLDTEIAKYGQHDASDSDTTIRTGQLALMNAAARARLAELAARIPTFGIRLRRGFWQGRDHIDIGDWVSVQIGLGNELISGKYRVSEIAVTVDAAGGEDVSLTLGNPRPASDPRSRLSATARLVRRLKDYQRKGPVPKTP